MKTSLLVTALFLSATLRSLAQSDEQVIKQVLYNETEGFFSRDKARWANAWAHAPYVHFAANLYGGDFLLVKGWDNLEKMFTAHFRSSKPADKVVVQNANYTFHQNGNMAYVAYDQTLLDSHDKTTSKESRVVEKINGQWKIIDVTALTNLKNFGLAQKTK